MPVCQTCWQRVSALPCPRCEAGALQPVVVPVVQAPAANLPEVLPRRPGPVEVRRFAGPAAVYGVVTRSDGPYSEPGRRNPWKWACGLVAAAFILPLWMTLKLVGVSLRLTLALFGLRGLGSGRRHSLVDEILLHRWLQEIFEPPADISVYHHTVETPGGFVTVRQEGEFTGGRVYARHQSEFRGRWRDGVLVAREGWDHSRGTALRFRQDPWPLVLGLLLVSLTVLLGAIAVPLLSAMASSPELGPTLTSLLGGR